MTRTQIEKKLETLNEALDTTRKKINELGDYVSYPQLYVWRKQRSTLKTKIKFFEEKLKGIT